MGITRVANITGLDTVGLPVVMVCRPNARSLAVSQGKGLDLDSAKASGVMEAIESYHAEHVDLPLRLASWFELAEQTPVADVRRLPRLSMSTFHPRRPTLWVEGTELMSGESVWVPYEMVHTNFSLPLPTGSGSFAMSSNGLASGNHRLEAISHGICETVERDANALWSLTGGMSKDEARVDPDTIDDPDARRILEAFAAAELAVGIWETTTDVGIPSYACVIVDEKANYFRQLYHALGSGCHPVREVALLRALTEAAQCRLTYISGSRDDGDRAFFERARNPERVARIRDQIRTPASLPRRFVEAPTHASPGFLGDVAWELSRLRDAGIGQAIAVDLTRPEFGIPVVRVIVPGLEALHDAPGYVPGLRAQAVMGGGRP
jgi:ribosomal protein S12 methylthiotransferase accessory factor